MYSVHKVALNCASTSENLIVALYCADHSDNVTTFYRNYVKSALTDLCVFLVQMLMFAVLFYLAADAGPAGLPGDRALASLEV